MSDYKPITGELRGVMFITESEQGTPMVELGKYRFTQLCDAIDAIHAGLERENAALKAELDRVLGEQDEHTHTRGGSITDELREYALGWDERNRVRCDLTAIADRIDAEHERAVMSVMNDALYHANEESMAELGWVRLPKDENGESFHIGELVDEMLPFGGYAAPAPIDTMELYRGASGYGWMVKLDAENRAFISPKLLRHYHAPIVEDVLAEFFEEVGDGLHTLKAVDTQVIIAKYAAKLRLAEGEDV